MISGVLAFLILAQDADLSAPREPGARAKLFKAVVGEALAARIRAVLPELEIDEEPWQRPVTWRALFLELAPLDSEPPRGLLSRDLEPLARLALDAGGDAGEIDEVVFQIGQRGLFALLPRVAELLQHPDGEVRARILDRLGGWGDPLLAPELVPLLESRDPETAAGAVRALASMRWPRLAPWCRRFLADDRVELPPVALHALVRLRDRESLPDILPFLDHPDPSLRAAATEAAALLGGRPALPKIRARLEDKDGPVRACAVRMLAQLRDDDSLPELLKRLGDRSPGVRSAVLEAIDEVWPAERTRLVALLRDPDKYVRSLAVSRMRWSRLPEAIPVLGELLQKEKPTDSLWEAAVELRVPEAVPIVRSRLRDPDLGVRRAAMRDAAALRFPRAEVDVLPLIRHEDPQVRQEAWACLGLLNALPEFRALLRDEDAVVRQTAASHLAGAGDRASIPLLYEMSRDPHPPTASEAAYALMRLGEPRGLELTVAHLWGGDQMKAGTAAFVLADAATPSVLPHLRKALDHPSPDVLRRAVDYLGERRDRESGPRLVPFLSHADANVRSSAFEALARIGLLDHLPVLRPLVDADAEDVRDHALQALAIAGDAASLPRILRRLEDASIRVRLEAVRAVGNLDDGGAWAAVAARLDDDDARIREAAAQALAKLGRLGAAPALEARVRDPDGIVRRAAVEALGDLGAPGARRAGETLLAIEGEDAAAWAAALRAGVPFDGPPPVEGYALNAARCSAVWKRLARRMFTRTPGDSIGESIERLAKEADLAVIWPKPLPEGVGRSQWQRSHESLGRRSVQVERRAWMIDALPASAGSLRLQAVLEDDRILLLSETDARAFWKRWIDEELRR